MGRSMSLLFLAFCILCYCALFFFSSRRRHTRLQGDWSSDVCSSDLKPRFATDDERHAAMERINQELRADQLRRLAEADRSIKISRAVGDLDLQSQYALDLAAEEDARFEQAVRITRRNAHWLAHPSESGLSAMDYLTWLRQFQET